MDVFYNKAQKAKSQLVQVPLKLPKPLIKYNMWWISVYSFAEPRIPVPTHITKSIHRNLNTSVMGSGSFRS